MVADSRLLCVPARVTAETPRLVGLLAGRVHVLLHAPAHLVTYARLRVFIVA